MALSGMFQPLLNQGTTPPPIAQPQQQADPYAGFQWNKIDPSQYMNPDQSAAWDLGNVPKNLGYSGNVWDSTQQGGFGENGNDMREMFSPNQGFLDWLKQNNYSIGQSYGPGGEQKRGTAHQGIIGADGKPVGVNSFEYDNTGGWMGKVVPGVLAGMLGVAGASALGFGPAAGGAATSVPAGGLPGSLYPGLGAGTSAGATLPAGVAEAIAADATGAGAAGGFNAAMDSQLANLGGDAVWGGAGGGMTGATVGGSIPSAVNLGSLGGTLSTGAGLSSVFNAAKDSQAASEQLGYNPATMSGPTNPAIPIGFPTGAKTLTDILTGAGKNLFNNATSPNGLGNLLGLINARNQRNGWDEQMRELDKNFSVDSPYAKNMRQQVERRDAAAGRNSQYGTREVELAGNLAEKKANAVKDLITMQNNKYAADNSFNRDLGAMFSAGGNNSIFSGLSSSFQDLLKLIGEG
jgi:hypothetical protein